MVTNEKKMKLRAIHDSKVGGHLATPFVKQGAREAVGLKGVNANAIKG